jgi:hypothetical protein
MNEALLFRDVAKGILKETIGNAVFIDDRAIPNFQSRSKNPALRSDHDRSIALYKDFKSKDCLLLISKFSKRAWRKDKNFNLNNKDLLILDWQLVGEEHEESLKILDHSVVKKGLHFCCIYTQATLEEVKNELNRFYLGKITAEMSLDIRAIIEESDLNDFWKLDKTHDDQVELDVLINNIANAKATDQPKEIKTFQERYGLTDDQIAQITSIVPNYINTSYVKFRSALTKEEEFFTKIPTDSLSYRLSELDRNTLYINHTIIKLFQKNDVSGDQLYESFFNSIMLENNIFLTLMGLEMRNRFRENSAFIGKDLDNISEEAFFFHKKQNKDTPQIFIEFLREILKDQVASFLYEKNLKIFDSLDNYYTENGMGAKVGALEGNSSELVKQSFKLNKFYNIINIGARKENDLLRFGDVFKYKFIKQEAGKPDVEILKYFLCITALCDCLHAEKIKNQFFFVEGMEVPSQASALTKTDGKFLSFLQGESEVVAVDWTSGKSFCIPFAMYIKENFVNETTSSMYHQQEIKMTYVGSLKENYTQRIANESFGYPLRVGIDFVKK